MNENYVKMLEIPVNSSSVVFKPMKKKKKDVKRKVIEMVNANQEPELTESQTTIVIKKPLKAKKLKIKKPKAVESVNTVNETSVKKGGFDIISAQVVAIFALVVAIILTNIFWEDSGMNVLFRNVFNSSDYNNEIYTSFTAYCPSKTASVTLEEGVMTVESGSVYSPCGGVVSSITEKDGLYTVNIAHSDSFTTVISGLETVYAEMGETVYENVPVGYSSSAMQVSMFDKDVILTGYVLSGSQIVWLG